MKRNRIIRILNNIKKELKTKKYTNEYLEKIDVLKEEISFKIYQNTLDCNLLETYFNLLKKYNLLFNEDYLTFNFYKIKWIDDFNFLVTYHNKILYNHETINKFNYKLESITLDNDKINYDIMTSREFYMIKNISIINKTTSVPVDINDIITIKKQTSNMNESLEISVPLKYEEVISFINNIKDINISINDKFITYKLNNIASSKIVNVLYEYLTTIGFVKVNSNRLIDNLNRCTYDDISLDNFFKEETNNYDDIVNNLKILHNSYNYCLNPTKSKIKIYKLNNSY